MSSKPRSRPEPSEPTQQTQPSEPTRKSRPPSRPEKGQQTEPEPKQRTDKGLEIPVPKWREVLRDLEKVAKPSERRDDRRRPAGEP